MIVARNGISGVQNVSDGPGQGGAIIHVHIAVRAFSHDLQGAPHSAPHHAQPHDLISCGLGDRIKYLKQTTVFWRLSAQGGPPKQQKSG
jgi:hypothetical protein